MLNSPLAKEWKWRLIGLAGSGLIRLIFSRSRFDTIGFDAVSDTIRTNRFISAVWHSRILAFVYLYRGVRGAALVSQSDDGEIIARILGSLGYETVRGSTTRGGRRALAELIRRVQEGLCAVIIPDGPQGPRFRAQPGILILAKKTGLPIIPMTYSAQKAFVFKSWDRFMLPYPRNRFRVIYGEPVHVPPDADMETVEGCRRRLEEELSRITRNADRCFGHKTESSPADTYEKN